MLSSGLSLSLSASINNTTPISVRIGYISLDVSLPNGAGRLARITSTRPLALGRGPNTALSLGVDAELGRGRAIAEGVRKLWDDFQAKRKAEILVGGIVFGETRESAFWFLSEVNVPVPLPFDTLTVGGGAAATGGNGNGNALGGVSVSGVDISTTETGLRAALGVSLPSSPVPFSINVRIGYIGFELLLARARLGTVALSNLGIALSGSGVQNIALPPVDLVLRPEDSGASTRVAELVNPIIDALLTGRALSAEAQLAIGGLMFGNSRQEAFDLLALVAFEFKVPITIPGRDTVGGAGSSAGNATAPGIGLDPRRLDIVTTPTGLAASLQATLRGFQFPLTVRFGYLAADLSLDRAVRVATIGVSNLELKQSQAGQGQDLNLPVDVRLAPEDPGAAEKVAEILNPLLGGNGEARSVELGIRGFVFGPSSENTFGLLRECVVGFKFNAGANGVLSLGAGSMNATALTTGGNNNNGVGFAPSSLAFATTPDGLRATVSGNLTGLSTLLPFPVTVSIGYISAEALLNRIRLAALTIQNLELDGSGQGASQALTVPISLVLAPEDSRIAGIVADFINPLLSNSTGTVPNVNVGVSGLVFGPNASTTFGILKLVYLDVTRFIQGAIGGSGNGTRTNNNNGTIAAPLLTLPKVNLTSAEVSTTSEGVSAVIQARLETGSGLPFPVSIEVGYLSADLTLSGTKFATVSVRDVSLSSTTQELRLPVLAKLRPEEEFPGAADAVGQVVNPWLSFEGPLIALLGVNGIRFGASPDSTFGVLSLVKIPLPTVSLPPIGESASANRVAGNDNGPVEGVDITTTPWGLSANVKANIGNALASLPVSLKIGYVSVDVSLAINTGNGVQNVKLTSVTVENLQLTPTTSRLELPIAVRLLPEDPELAKQIAEVVNLFLNNNGDSVGIGVGLGGLVFGTGPTETVNLLKKVAINISVLGGGNALRVTGNGTATNGTLALPANANTTTARTREEGFGFYPDNINLGVTNTGFSARVQGRLRGLGFLSFPLRVFIGYLAADVSAGGARLATIDLQGLTVVGAQEQAIDVPASITLLPETPNAAQKLADIVNPLLSGSGGGSNEAITVNGILIGHSSTEVFRLLSLISVPILRGGGGNGGSESGSGSTLALPQIKITRGDISVTETGGLGVRLAFSLTPALPITISIPYVTFEAYAVDPGSNSQVKILDAGVSETKISPDGSLSTVGQFMFGQSDEVADAVARVIDRVLNGQGAQGGFVLTDLRFGAFVNVPLSVFRYIRLDVLALAFRTGNSVDSAARVIPAQPLPGIFKRIGANINLTPTGLSGGALLTLDDGLPFNIDVGWVGLKVATYNRAGGRAAALPDGRVFAEGSLNNVKFNNQDQPPVDLRVDIPVDNVLLPSLLDHVIDAFLDNTDIPIALEGLSFGRSSGAGALRFLSKVRLPLAKLLGNGGGGGGGNGTVGEPPFSIGKFEFCLLCPGVKFDVTNRLPLDIGVGTVGSSLKIGQETGASVTVRDVDIKPGKTEIRAAFKLRLGTLIWKFIQQWILTGRPINGFLEKLIVTDWTITGLDGRPIDWFVQSLGSWQLKVGDFINRGRIDGVVTGNNSAVLTSFGTDNSTSATNATTSLPASSTATATATVSNAVPTGSNTVALPSSSPTVAAENRPSPTSAAQPSGSARAENASPARKRRQIRARV
ncbi:hypothetical protein HK102_000447 [Quaeritorhiza haematococci]|nr:hypothetical protein HK102_000447 [Quaeritorhiza haematococci]